MSIQIDSSKVPTVDAGFICGEVMKYLNNHEPRLVALTENGNFQFEVVQTGVSCGNRLLEVRNLSRKDRTTVIIRITAAVLTPWGMSFVPIEGRACQLLWN